jgi:hypothetical protein
MKKTLIYILAILLSFGCSSRNKKPPEKPKDVPHAAKWYGGEDTRGVIKRTKHLIIICIS